MRDPIPRADLLSTAPLPPSFSAWHRAFTERGTLPIIAVAGSRGKTTVVRLLDAIYRTAGLRTAIWTNCGVEMDGQCQSGELGPWAAVLAALSAGRIDVAIQELDWSVVHVVGLPSGSYPVVAVTNVCGNDKACSTRPEARRARQAMATVVASVHPRGVVVLNGEDFAVAEASRLCATPAIMVALSRDAPRLRAHLAGGGMAAWATPDRLAIGSSWALIRLCSPGELGFALGGHAGFQLHNALTAAAVALACGIGPDVVARALCSFGGAAGPVLESFNVVTAAGTTVVVDRPAPSWFLRPVLRAVTSLTHRPFLTVVGGLTAVPDFDLAEVGRLIGQRSAALILHSVARTSARAALLRQGLAHSEAPPVVIHVPNEQQALSRALWFARARDALLVLADQPAEIVRTLVRPGGVGLPQGPAVATA